MLAVYSSAIRVDNPEVGAARQMGIPIVRRATVLAVLMQQQRGICVAGMHGKTTTTALLAYALAGLQEQPSYAVGSRVPQLECHARFSCGAAPNWFVAETDESDGTLREFHPEHAIILNVDEEHLDYFANLEAICAEFRCFAGQTSGKLVYCADDPELLELFAERENAISYGFNPLARYRIEIRAGVMPDRASPDSASTLFEVWRGAERIGEFATRLSGEKNISNSAAVVVLLHELGFAAHDIAGAIAPFAGAARRQQELFRDSRFRVFDDYGHHPAEVQATLRALKGLGSQRLLVAFQPHRFTRTQQLLAEFSTCFAEADRLFLTEIYAASEEEIPGVTGALLAGMVRAQGQATRFCGSLEALLPDVRAEMQPGDLVLFLGAGSITQAARELAAQLDQEMSAANDQLTTELRGRLAPETVLRRDEPLARRTTLRVGGPADIYVEPASESDLALLLRFCGERQLPFMLLGRGSNLLIRDGGIRGVVISLCHAHFSRVEVSGEMLVCGAGARLKLVASEAKRAGLTGLEFLDGIPGTVGGALRMNAGAMGASTFEAVESIRVMDYAGEIHQMAADAVEVSYRKCPMLARNIALGAVLKGRSAPREQIEVRMEECNAMRWGSQPKEPSAGCIFKNPGTVPAGRLIDELGLKGMRVGGAVVSEVHGNFIVNAGQATARDVLDLIGQIRRRAREARGIDLETEVEIVGEP
jgi:UDP-N-acetylmuramate--L-alanine ligase/UDP-N-acetylenolpyruvoylglucosamine reductase